MEKVISMQTKTNQKDVDDDDKPVSAERVRLLMRINKYKELFKDECKDFKMKKGASVDQLKEYIKELQILTECGGMDCFFNDMILESIKGVEHISTYTSDYNLTGLSILLKSNKKFNTLCKQLQLKYNLFVNVPPEIQLVLIISTTAVLCVNKNKHKKELDAYLDEPIESIEPIIDEIIV